MHKNTFYGLLRRVFRLLGGRAVPRGLGVLRAPQLQLRGAGRDAARHEALP